MKLNNMKRILISQLCMLLFAACSNSEVWVERQPIPENAISVAVSFDVPGMSTSVTRGLTDADAVTINTIHVLVFKDDKYQYTTEGLDKGNNIFMIKLPKGETLDLTILTNIEQHLADLAEKGHLTPGDAKADVLDAVSAFSQPKVWSTVGDNRYLPMWAERTELTMSTGTELTDTRIALTRMHAAINVTTNIEGFELQEVWLCNANTVGYLIAKDERDDFIPSVDMQQYPVDTDANTCRNEIYTPEAPGGSDENVGNNICLVVKGKYNDGESYYRIDFVRKSIDGGAAEYFPLERNHQYSIQIVGVIGVGYDTKEAALEAQTAPLNTVVTTWDAGQIDNVEYAGGYMLGVSATAINLPSGGVTSKAPIILTIVSQGEAPTIIPALTEPNTADGITCSQSSTTDGKTAITITATGNTSTLQRTRTLTIKVGPLSQTVTITQADATPTIKIYDRDGKEIADGGICWYEYESVDLDLINCDFRVEWTPAHLEMKMIFEEDAIIDAAEEKLHWTNFHKSEINNGMLLNKKDNNEAFNGPYSGGVKTLSPRTKGMAHHTGTSDTNTYDGRYNMGAKFTVMIGDESRTFRMRVWTPYAAWVSADRAFTPDNFSWSATEAVTLRTNVPIGEISKQVLSNATSRAYSPKEFYIGPTKYESHDQNGRFKNLQYTINTPQNQGYHNFAGRSETNTIAYTGKLANCKPKGTNRKSLSLSCKDDCSKTRTITYATHPNYGDVWVSKAGDRAWMAHDLGGYFRFEEAKTACPTGMQLPTVRMVEPIMDLWHPAWEDVGSGNTIRRDCPIHRYSLDSSSGDRKYIAVNIRDRAFADFTEWAPYLIGQTIKSSRSNRIGYVNTVDINGNSADNYFINGYSLPASYFGCGCQSYGINDDATTNYYYLHTYESCTREILSGGSRQYTFYGRLDSFRKSDNTWLNDGGGFPGRGTSNGNTGFTDSYVMSVGWNDLNFKPAHMLSSPALLTVRCVSTKTY